MLYRREAAASAPLMGWKRDIDATTLESTRAWYERAARPEEATLVVVGDVEATALRGAVEKTLGVWASPAKAAPEAARPMTAIADGSPVLLVDAPPSSQVSIAMGAIVGPRASEDYYALL